MYTFLFTYPYQLMHSDVNSIPVRMYSGGGGGGRGILWFSRYASAASADISL